MPDIKQPITLQDVPAATGSLNRAAMIVREIANGPRDGMRLADVAKRTGLPRPTIYRSLHMLEVLGWVIRQPDGAFNLGPQLATVGLAAVARHPIEPIAAGILAPLAARIGYPVYLDLRAGIDTVCAGRYDSHSPATDSQGYIGMSVPLGVTASGLAMLVAMRPRARQAVVRRNLERYRRVQGFDEAGFLISLQRSVALGYGAYDAVVLNRTHAGIGVVVETESHTTSAAIGVAFPDVAWSAQDRLHALRLMRDAASLIGQAIAQSPLGL